MTLKPLTLEEYFHKIVNNPLKELTMFEYLKNKWTELLNTRYAFTDASLETQEGWAFVMKTESYVNEEGETIPDKEDIISGDNGSTWHEVLDQILDVMGKHYGYNIKEQVYYSVAMPMNLPGMAGYGRELNDEVLQKLLLSYPEVYEIDRSFDWKPL